jgi:hypothetical protein
MMGYYHHELEQYPDYIGYFRYDGNGTWSCICCEEELEEDEYDPSYPVLDEWHIGLEQGDDLVTLLRAFDSHVEEYHC